MWFPGPLLEATFLRRRQRFLADFSLSDGSEVTAHCANPGSMATCLEPGARSLLTAVARPERRLPYTWQVGTVAGARILVNPVLANGVVAEAIQRGWLPELAGYDVVEREVRFGEGTRFDLCLRRGERRCFVEVKSVTLLLGPGRAGFPDSVTARGTRHLATLEQVVAGGDRAVQLFVVAREGARSMAPADAIDPRYGAALRGAATAGVEVLAYGTRFGRRSIRLGERVPLVLQPQGGPVEEV
jgi:sugar fermentation stimulation protein A